MSHLEHKVLGFFGFFPHAERDRAKRSNGIVCIMPFQDRDSSFKIFRRDEREHLETRELPG